MQCNGQDAMQSAAVAVDLIAPAAADPEIEIMLKMHSKHCVVYTYRLVPLLLLQLT
jgi:hypothetical protein